MAGPSGRTAASVAEVPGCADCPVNTDGGNQSGQSWQYGACGPEDAGLLCADFGVGDHGGAGCSVCFLAWQWPGIDVFGKCRSAGESGLYPGTSEHCSHQHG